MPLSVQKNSLSSCFTGILLCILFLSGNLSAQENKINLTKQKLLKAKSLDTNRVNLFSELAFYYHTVNADSTLFYARKAKNDALKLSYRKGIADAYKLMAIAHYVKSEGDTAIKLNKIALKMYLSLGDLKGQGAVLNNIAIIYHNVGKYDESIITHKKALKLRLQVKDSIGIAGSYNNIANCYTDKGDYVNSLQNLFEALYIREKMGDTSAIANSYANIGGVYYLLKRNDEAYENALKAYQLQKAIGDKEGLVQSLTALGAVHVERQEFQKSRNIFNESLKYATESSNLNGVIVACINLGEVYGHLNKPDSSMEFYKKALKLAIETGDYPSEGISNNGIGNAFIKMGLYKQALPYNQKANMSSKLMGNKLLEFESSKSLGIIHEKLNNSIKALEYYKRTLALKDSIFNEENARKTHQIAFNYLLEKKQNEITLLEKDKSIQEARNDWNRLFTLFLIIIIAALAFFAYNINKFRLKEKSAKDLIWKQKNEIEKQAKNLESLNNIKNKTLSILSHDLRNPVASLTNVVELMDENVLSEEDFKNIRSNFRSQLKSLNLLLDNTLNWAKSQMIGEIMPNKSNVAINEIILQNLALFAQTTTQKEISIIPNLQENLKVNVDKNHIDIVIRNILSNAIKFTKPGGKVWVQSKLENNKIVVEIKDNGIGMSEVQLSNLFSNATKQGNYGTAGETGTGIGLILSNDYITRNSGELIVWSKLGEGTTFCISLPA